MKVIIINENDAQTGEFRGCSVANNNIAVTDENGTEHDIATNENTRFVLEGYEDIIITNLHDLIQLYNRVVQ